MRNINCILVIDKSASMKLLDGNQSNTLRRWDVLTEWAIDLMEGLCGIDEDGIDLILFDDEVRESVNVKSVFEMKKILSSINPSGSTDLKNAVSKAIDICIARQRLNRSELIIVITDGNPQGGELERKSLERKIVETAKKIKHRNELSIGFIQVGRDEECYAFLKELDDNMTAKHNIIDFIDTKTYKEVKDMPFKELLRNIYED